MNSRGSVLPGSQNLGQWSTYFFLKRTNRKYFQLCRLNDLYRGFPNGSVVKNLPAKTGHTRDAGSIPWLSKIPGKQEMATHFSVLAWKIPWTEESGRLPSMGSQRVRHDLATEHAHSLCSMNTQHHGSTRYCFCTLWNECAWALIIFFNHLKMQKHFLVHEYNKVSGRSEFCHFSGLASWKVALVPQSEADTRITVIKGCCTSPLNQYLKICHKTFWGCHLQMFSVIEVFLFRHKRRSDVEKSENGR